MLIKVQDGTEEGKESSSLCRTCRNAFIAKGNCRTLVLCDSAGYKVNVMNMQPVSYCTDYADRRVPSIHSMQNIAWTLRPDRKTHEMGFLPPANKSSDGRDKIINPKTGEEIW